MSTMVRMRRRDLDKMRRRLKVWWGISVMTLMIITASLALLTRHFVGYDDRIGKIITALGATMALVAAAYGVWLIVNARNL